MGKRRKTGGYSAEDCEVLFDKEEEIQETDRRAVRAMRTKTTKHGPMLDVEIFPVWNNRAIRETAIRQRGAMKEAQLRCSLRKSQTRLVQLANANFGPGDCMVSPTPFRAEDEEDARRKIRNYLRRLKRLWKDKPFKYIYAVEWTDSKKNGKRWHAHILLNAAGIDRDVIEGMWHESACNTRRYTYNEQGFGALAGYLKIEKQGRKRYRGTPEDELHGKAGKRIWNASRNLEEPKVTRADHKVSVRKAERIAAAMQAEAREIIEKAYPGYRIVSEIDCHRSDWVPGVYVRARLRVVSG
jgi:hypothetical protein